MKYLKRLLSWLHYKFLAKYEIQDTARGFNGDVSESLTHFTPATNSNPPTDWKGSRVEVEERHRKSYKKGAILNRSFSFILLDETLLDDVEYAVIHQLWTSGHRMPKYVAYINKVDGQLYFRIRYADTSWEVDDYEFQFSKRLPIEVGKLYVVGVTVKVHNTDEMEPEGRLSVYVDSKLLWDIPAYTQDPNSILLEKYGLYWNRGADVTANKYPETLIIKLFRNWLPDTTWEDK